MMRADVATPERTSTEGAALAGVHYFDHATTAWPKAPGVAEAISAFYCGTGVAPARSGHRLGRAADKLLSDARRAAGQYFHARSASHVIFTSGATESLNLVLRSVVRPGDAVVVSTFDHNAVARPVARLALAGARVTTVRGRGSLRAFATAFMGAIEPSTKLAVLTQACNVDGTVLPIAEIARHARRLGVPVLIDGAQSSGWLERAALICNSNVDTLVEFLHEKTKESRHVIDVAIWTLAKDGKLNG